MHPAVYKHHAWEVKQILGPEIPLAIHSHNDFELGTAGQLAALEGGAEILEGCINGLGERAGVPNLAVLASVVEIMYGYETGLKLDKLQDLSEWVADVWNQPIPPHMSGTGQTAFSHAAEVHYALPEGDEWSFNAWSPRVSATMPTSRSATTRDRRRSRRRSSIAGGIRSMTRRRTVCSTEFARRCGHEDANPPIACSRRSSTKNSGAPERRPDARRFGERRDTMGQMDGKNVFLTGASKGMGREMARGLAKEGATIALVARTKPALEELAEELNGLGGRGIAIPADVSDRQQVKDAVARAREELGEIHVLINSAGVLDNEPIAGHNDEVWEHHYGVNVNSYFFTIREIIGEMMDRGSGRVINIASTSSKVPIGPNRAAYVSSKHAVLGLTKEIAFEAAPTV